MDFSQETLKGRRYVDARLKGSAESREEHLFPDGEGGNIGRSDGREARSGEPRSAAVWWKSETRWSRFPVVGRGERGAGVPILEGPP